MAKWIKRDGTLYNLEAYPRINKFSFWGEYRIILILNEKYNDVLYFDTEQERDNEFDRIKKLLGIEE